MVLSKSKSIVCTQRAFRRKYSFKTSPCVQTIRNIVKKFEEDGSVANRVAPGPYFTAITPPNISKIKNLHDTQKESFRERRKSVSQRSKDTCGQAFIEPKILARLD
eukprot:TRINITY_DN6135_c0_g1_i1.p1 TRINITY_DN6135_c0_g1~~TRINITY_DN6135_c0_g1_i1.p1  ORF type:complete len:106 (-),score=1.27 TRINITY_DN6135_c0_g1_i1:49-366(-)